MAPVADSGPLVLAGGNLDGSETSWFEANWMFFSWAFALFGFGVLVARKRDPLWHGWLGFVMYCLHQAEEHAYDIRGWRYAFVPALNQGFGKALFGFACTTDTPVGCPMDPKQTMYINTVAIWVGFGGCMVVASIYDRFLFAGSLNWGTAVVNGIFGHLLQVALTGSYNPGSVQSALMVPLGLYIIWCSARPWLCLANGVLFHVVAFGIGINVVFRAHAPEEAMIAFNALAALAIPLGLAWWIDHPRAAYNYKAIN